MLLLLIHNIIFAGFKRKGYNRMVKYIKVVV